MSEAANPYAAPAARVDDTSASSEAVAIRREHISHEAAIRSIGILYYLGGFLVTLGAFGALLTATRGSDLGANALLVAVLVAVGAAQVAVGWGVRGLKRWGRTVGTVLSVLGLLAFPIGTLVHGYILYLLWSAKGRRIFGPGYAEVVAATPEMRYKTSIVVWIVLALIVGGLVAAILIPMVAK